MPATMIPTAAGFPLAVEVSGPENGSAVVFFGAPRQPPNSYDAVCQRLHTASLRTVVIAADPRLTAQVALGLLDTVGVRWAVVVGDRAGGLVAWELAANRLDRFTALVAVDCGHPRVPDTVGVIRGADCAPVELNTTVLASGAAMTAVAQASAAHVYADFRLVQVTARRGSAEATAQLASEIVLRTSTW